MHANPNTPSASTNGQAVHVPRSPRSRCPDNPACTQIGRQGVLRGSCTATCRWRRQLLAKLRLQDNSSLSSVEAGSQHAQNWNNAIVEAPGARI